MLAATTEEMRLIAMRRIPKMVFDFIDGGAGTETALKRNVASFRSIQLIPRVATGAMPKDIGVSLFGTNYQAPFGVAPMGLCNLVSQGADLAIAKAASTAGIPYINGTTSTTTIEDIAEGTGHLPWFQLYSSSDEDITNSLVKRARAAGCPVLVVTLDMPVPGLRPRDLRNGFCPPFRLNPSSLLYLVTRPRWLWGLVRGGIPRFANLEPHLHVPQDIRTFSKIMALQTGGRLDWTFLAQLRECWPGHFVLKGILDPRDAEHAVSLGIDGIIVSNHGGRQLDAAPAPAEVIGEIRSAVGEKLSILLDGGIRSGEDVVKGIALGADLVLLGRPFLYAVAAFGSAGPSHLIDLLIDDIYRTLALLGLGTINYQEIMKNIKVRRLVNGR
ncbi:MAG: alpha-hydroxy acid oxidase [Xenococcus sp. MO_188.B8]|nr:alpha-hydroxy acid oxidase [Xenococcus sp. MO_188.B8]